MIISQSCSDVIMGSALVANASVSNLSTAVVPKLLTSWRTNGCIRENRRCLTNAYRTIHEFLTARDIDHVPVSAGLCVFARLGKRGTVKEEATFARELAKVNLKLVPGKFYHFSAPGWFRIVFSVSHGEMEEALRRLRAVLDSVDASLGGPV